MSFFQATNIKFFGIEDPFLGTFFLKFAVLKIMMNKYIFKMFIKGFKCVVLFFVSLLVFLNFANANELNTDLFSALNSGDLEIVEQQLSHGANVNAADKYGRTPLYRAVSRGYLEMVSLLLSHGADVNTADEDGVTVLYWPVADNNLEMASLLLSHGADVNIADQGGRTPLYRAVSRGYLEMVSLLLKHGADVNITDQGGKRPLYWAAYAYRAGYVENLEIANLLIDSGAILDAHSAKTCFENMSVDTLESFLRRENVQSAIRGFLNDIKRDLLDSLVVRELALGPTMTPLIEWFEAQFGVRRGAIPGAVRNVIREGLESAWTLNEVIFNQGVDAAKELIENKVCIGIVTVRGLFYDHILEAAKHYEQMHTEFAFYYVTRAMIDMLGVDAFSGLIFPGANDNYPRGLSEFTLADMPENSRTETEVTYQYVYEQAQLVGVPTLGICAGAQHLALHREAALTPNKTHNRDVSLIPFRVPHFLSLTIQERKALLEHCEAPQLMVDVFRAHSYSAVTESLQEQGFELGVEDGETPLAFYQDFDTLGIQFHPEARYEGTSSSYGDRESRKRQTNLINGFFELCGSYQSWVDWGCKQGISRKDALKMREELLQDILERLAECEENPNALDRVGLWHEEELLFQPL